MEVCAECGKESARGFTMDGRWVCSEHTNEVRSVAHLTYRREGASFHEYAIGRAEFQSLLTNPSVHDVVVLKLTWTSLRTRKWRKKGSDAYRRFRTQWIEER